MSSLRMFVCSLALGLVLFGAITFLANAAEPAGGFVAHNVYFSLNDNSDAAKEKLVAACVKYLTGHQGTVFFAAGVLAREFDRPVNDRDFDVSLHVIFDSKAAHDRYQKHERHLKFIEDNSANWKKVRVFDSYVGKPAAAAGR